MLKNSWDFFICLVLPKTARVCDGLSIPHGILPSLFRRCVHQRLSIFHVDGFILAIGNPGSLLLRRPGSPGSPETPTRSANSTPIRLIRSNGENGGWLRIFAQNLSLSQVKLPFSGPKRKRSLKRPCSSPRPWVLDPNLPLVFSEWRPRTCQPPGRGWFIPSIFDEKFGITWITIGNFQKDTQVKSN